VVKGAGSPSVIWGYPGTTGEGDVYVANLFSNFDAATVFKGRQANGGLQEKGNHRIRDSRARKRTLSFPVPAPGSGVISERLVRWLLMCDNRFGGDELLLTHEFLGNMWGGRRSGVTETIHLLKGVNIIRRPAAIWVCLIAKARGQSRRQLWFPCIRLPVPYRVIRLTSKSIKRDCHIHLYGHRSRELRIVEAKIPPLYDNGRMLETEQCKPLRRYLRAYQMGATQCLLKKAPRGLR
jgi:hypothetical protein